MRGWKNLLDLAGDAWHAIGDTSTDVNDPILIDAIEPGVFFR